MRKLTFYLIVLALIAVCTFQQSFCQKRSGYENLFLTQDAFLQNPKLYDYRIEKLDQCLLQVAPENTHQIEGDVQVAWVKHYAEGNSPGMDTAVEIAVDGAGYIYVAGRSQVPGVPFKFGAYDFTLIKYNPAGQRLWIRWFDGSSHGNDISTAMIMDIEGNIIITGYSDFFTESGYGTGYATVKFDSTGRQLWAAYYFVGETTYSYPADIMCDDNGNVYVAGVSYQGGQKRFVTIKYDPAGLEQWVSSYEKTSGWDDSVAAIATDDSENVFITGWTTTSETGEDYITIKYNSTGIEQWVIRYNGIGVASFNDDRANDLVIDQNGNIYVMGQTSVIYSDYDFLTVKYNRSGIQQWVRQYDGPGHQGDQARKIALDNSGNIYVTGNSIGTNTRSDITTIKYAPDGTELWVTRYNGYNAMDDYAADLVVDNSTNTVYVVGQSYEYSLERAWDYVTIKYDFSGNTQWFRNYNAYQVSNDYGKAVAVDQSANVYVTGTAGYDEDARKSYFATIKYDASGEEHWMDQYNGMAIPYKYPMDFVIDDNGNSYVTGYTWDPSGYGGYFTVKYDSTGIEEWSAVQKNGGWPNAIALDRFGNVYVTGTSKNSSNNYDYTTIKYDIDGKLHWIVYYNGTGNATDEAYDLTVDALGNVYVTGSFQEPGELSHYATIKYNSEGKEQWVAIYRSEVKRYHYAKAIALDNMGNVYVTGDLGTIKYKNLGIRQWIANYPAYAIELDKTGNIYVTGPQTSKYDSEGNQQWAVDTVLGKEIAIDDSGNVYVIKNRSSEIIKIDSSGEKQWVSSFIGTNPALTSEANAIALDKSGNIYITGWSYGPSNTEDYLTIKYNSFGEKLWTTYYHGYDDVAIGIAVDHLDNVYVTGTTFQRAFDYYTKYWSIITTIKYIQTPTSVKQEINNHPDEYLLFQNYPNPFNPATTIEFTLPKESFVTLKIYNLLGQEVATLVDEPKPMGENQVQWQAGDLPSGVYLYRLEAHSSDNNKSKSYEEAKKLILLK